MTLELEFKVSFFFPSRPFLNRIYFKFAWQWFSFLFSCLPQLGLFRLKLTLITVSSAGILLTLWVVWTIDKGFSWRIFLGSTSWISLFDFSVRSDFLESSAFDSKWTELLFSSASSVSSRSSFYEFRWIGGNARDFPLSPFSSLNFVSRGM